MYNSLKRLGPVLLVMPLLLALSGCKQFLDRKPLTATLEDLNQGALEGQILGMYSKLRTDAGFSTLPWIDFHSIRDDDAQKGSSASDGAEVVQEFDRFNYSKDDWAPNTYWNDHYSMITLTNNALATADSLKLTDAVSARNVGEALFFRAYSYFELIKTYGEVPLFNFPVTSAANAIRPKATVTRLYEFIDSNLQAAARLLPASSSAYSINGSGFEGRLTNGAAKTLWAQTYLFRQNWGRVITLCNEVIASGRYALLPNFQDIWKDGVRGAGKNSAESIWEMQAYTGENAQSVGAQDRGSDWGTCQQVRQSSAPQTWNLGWGWNTPTDKLEAEWPLDDPRKRKTILYSGQSDGGLDAGGYSAVLPPYTNPDGTGGGFSQKFWNKKVYTGNDPAMRSFTGFILGSGSARWINHRILRYADVMLMLAEAANESGDGVTAAANLERIRNRASGNLGPTRTVLPPIPFASQAQMRTAIKNERRWEFAMEGYRFYDLVRWNDALTVLGPLGYTNRCRYYPLPQQAITLSGGVLVQNPEW